MYTPFAQPFSAYRLRTSDVPIGGYLVIVSLCLCLAALTSV